MLVEVLLAALDVWLDGVGSWSPSGRAHFSVLLDELEGLDETEGLVDGAADWQVVDRDLTQVLLRVDDEESCKMEDQFLELQNFFFNQTFQKSGFFSLNFIQNFFKKLAYHGKRFRPPP